MKKRPGRPECVRLRQALWISCITFGSGILMSLCLCHILLQWLIGLGCITLGLWRLIERQ